MAQGKIRIRVGPLRYERFAGFIPERTATTERKAFFLLVHLVHLSHSQQQGQSCHGDIHNHAGAERAHAPFGLGKESKSGGLRIRVVIRRHMLQNPNCERFDGSAIIGPAQGSTFALLRPNTVWSLRPLRVLLPRIRRTGGQEEPGNRRRLLNMVTF